MTDQELRELFVARGCIRLEQHSGVLNERWGDAEPDYRLVVAAPEFVDADAVEAQLAMTARCLLPGHTIKRPSETSLTERVVGREASRWDHHQVVILHALS